MIAIEIIFNGLAFNPLSISIPEFSSQHLAQSMVTLLLLLLLNKCKHCSLKLQLGLSSLML